MLASVLLAGSVAFAAGAHASRADGVAGIRAAVAGAHASRADGVAGIRAAVAGGACPGSGTSELGRPPLPFGDAREFGALPRTVLNRHLRIVAMAADPDGGGYWLASAGGRVFGYGSARFHGSAAVARGDRIVAIVPTHDGRGYVLASSNGRLFAFGDARVRSALEPRPAAGGVVSAAATPDGRGYWLASADGRVTSVGDTTLRGSAPSRREGGDIVAIVATPGGPGYWLAAASGGVLSYGAARYYGSAIGEHAHARIVGMAATRDGHGYWLVAANGTVLSFGDAADYGSAPAAPAAPATTAAPAAPIVSIVSIAALADGRGYWLLPTIGPAPGLPSPGKGFAACHVTAIGDSVMLDVEPSLQAAIPGVAVDATVSRQWDAGVALAAQLRSQGVLGAIVVVDLGTNGPVSWQQFTNMMDVLAGASRVVFVTVHLPASVSWSQSVNSTLEQGVARYRRDRLADFNRLADTNPQWFAADGVHMPIAGPGAQAMAALIKAAI
ncbi:MAG: hypothetical protein ABSH27_00195 [Solirubrobacteraceae bacterium]